MNQEQFKALKKGDQVINKNNQKKFIIVKAAGGYDFRLKQLNKNGTISQKSKITKIKNHPLSYGIYEKVEE